jgi:hypothetical protein
MYTNASLAPEFEAQTVEEKAAAALHPVSRMSTDFLNQYNEVAMTLDMLADWPDMLEEFRDWRCRSYVEHFAQSGLCASESIIAAYAQTPDEIRVPFEALDRILGALTQSGLQALFAVPHGPALAQVGQSLANHMRQLVDELDGLINRHGTIVVEDAPLAAGLDQSSIDSLFD